MTTIINLTQHNATDEQIALGVVETADKAEIQTLLTFNSIPTQPEMIERAEAIAHIVASERNNMGLDDSVVIKAMIGGAPFFMSTLERVLMMYNIQPVYAFSIRQSIDEVQADGSVVKRAVFKHAGFVEI